MRSLLTPAALAAALLLGSACSQEQATENTAQAAGEPESGNMSAMMNDPNNPYAQSEMRMNERMMAAVGANPSETWLRKMIEHHRGAIEMSNIALERGGDPQILETARKTVADQTKEIAELERMLPQGAAAGGGAANPYADAERKMHEQMMAAMGGNPAETWARKMVVHHRGGVEMSNLLVAQGGDPKVVQKARMTAQKQAKEADDLERILQGGGAAAAPAAEKASAPAPAAAPAAQPKEKAAPKARTETPKAKAKAAETPKADPHAGHDMNKM